MDDTMADDRWPDGFGQVGGLTFEEAFEKEKKLVQITLSGMSQATGIFKSWFDFCKQKEKESDGQITETCDGEGKSGD